MFVLLSFMDTGQTSHYRYISLMFFTVNVMLFGCFSLLTLCYLDVFHCERYVNWMYFTVNVMLFGCLSLLTLC